MRADDFAALARALRAEMPEGPQVLQGERIVWRRIVERISVLVPKESRERFLNACGAPSHLLESFLTREATRCAEPRHSKKAAKRKLH